MAYRTIKREKPVRRILQDMTTKNMTMVQNGATAHLAIPCWYMEVRHPQHTHVHDREWHDHIGWPRPGHPDDSCQNEYRMDMTPYFYDDFEVGWHHPGRYLDMSEMHPIHLLKEGYTTVEVAFVDPPQGLSATGNIRQEDGWVVRFSVNPNCQSALTEDVDVQYAVFVKGTVGNVQRRDVVARGTLRILAGPIS